MLQSEGAGAALTPVFAKKKGGMNLGRTPLFRGITALSSLAPSTSGDITKIVSGGRDKQLKPSQWALASRFGPRMATTPSKTRVWRWPDTMNASSEPTVDG
jgi:hypothetical protein